MKSSEKNDGTKAGNKGFINKLLRNMRFSLAFRIANHFAWQFLRSTFIYLVLFTVIYWSAYLPSVLRMNNRVINALPDQITYDTPIKTGDFNLDVYLSSQTLPQGSELVREQAKLIFSQHLFASPPLIRYAVSVSEGTLIFTMNIAAQADIYICLIITLVLFDLLRAVSFIGKRNSLGKTVLKPIQEITDMAATLSANNLSNRINIAGTKNELKDLALVINNMLDRIERSYNSQKQFVSDASHELRTPIAVIQGYINMLDRWGKDDPAVLDESISAITQEMNSMKDLVESLLFLARHDKKTLMLEIEVFDPCEVAAAVHREAKLISSGYVFTLSPLEHCMIQADKNMVKQVLRVLCDNAVKYTPEGGQIRIGVQAAAEGCLLSVTDTGTGIKAEDLPKIFDRFYRSDSARTAQLSGHGLGLSIARIIVLAHGGKMNVRSKNGAGSTFIVQLPYNGRIN